VLNDMVIVDATIHGYNWTRENWASPLAETVVEPSYGFHAMVSPKHARLDHDEWVADWTPEMVEPATFAESPIDLACYHATPQFDFFRDGQNAYHKGVELKERNPGRMLLYGAVNPYHDDALEQVRRMKGEDEYLAGWVVSEPAGTPGGTANFDHPGGHPVGIGVTAIRDSGRGEYVLNGRKYWPCNAGGWDLQVANVNVVIVRTDPTKGGHEGVSAALVARGTPGVRYEQPIDKIGHRLCQNNSMIFEDCRIPEENIFALGNGDLIVSKAFTWSGPVAAIAAVGVARSAYEYTLDWAKTYTAGGKSPIINHQAVGYLLTDIAMRIEACRYFSWKAAHYLDLHDSEGHAIGAMSKVFCGELLFDTVFKCMQVMGVNAVDKKHPLEKYLREAVIFPLYDAGNIGMQRRKIWGVMADPSFNPRAFVDNEAIEFKKSMEGIGTAIAGE
jgi:alkylation response protein AidB-like acyl-CoA dehydrogenase